jgi:hypothetical protein
MLLTIALWIPTALCTAVAIVFLGVAAIMAVQHFWRHILVLLGLAIYVSHPEARLLVGAAGLVAVIGWGWEFFTERRLEPVAEAPRA